MTAQHTPGRKIAALYRSVFVQRIDGVVRACWREPALRAEIRTKQILVYPDEKQQNARGHRHLKGCVRKIGGCALVHAGTPKRRDTSVSKSLNISRRRRWFSPGPPLSTNPAEV